jgi:aminoglycoside 6'-N-acetyltransferase
MHGWLQQPHVRAFWDDGDRTLDQVRAHYFADDWDDTEPFIFTLDGRLAGYIQAYPVPPDAEFGSWRAGVGQTWGIDLFIGEPGLIGKGHGGSIIQAFMGLLRDRCPELRRVLIDPEVQNARAIHVYDKAGFSPLARIEHESKQLQLLALDLD